ncbi:zona pellucida sperm-binding protein 4-like [Mastacembelus armatus]|uniref:zona pellucida sperm-binding protein 4-like n=1 Tax=Mastacembelus armatus TaxID=205130 RepID=UPI000E464F29|nr:zona pellucida sperm-binding protein 4-like [Mastacembelus armatus]
MAQQRCWCFSHAQVEETPERKLQLVQPTVTCSARRLKAVFGSLVQSNVRVEDMSGAKIPVPQSEGPCGLRTGRDKDQRLSVVSRYDSCYAQIEDRKVVLPLQVQLMGVDQWFRVNVSCPLVKRSNARTRLSPTPAPGPCDTERALRVDCGHQNVSQEVCSKLGCCYDDRDQTCYYRMNACSLDGHFVFSVKATDTDPPVDPRGLMVKDQPQCSPVVTTPDTAVFKIGVTDCGAKMKVDKDMIIYEIDVEELLARGRSPFSLLVQCEYDLKHEVNLPALYAVTNPPPVTAMGTIHVQMRIATDASFTSFFTEDQLPLTLPLRKAAYVEVSIAQPSPDPTLSLRVQDCFAFPASRHSVWTLLYDGCSNPLDNMRSSVPVGAQGISSHSQVKRFDVKTFAFLDPVTGHPSVEEMFFYCWVEICTDDADCAQPCGFVSSERRRRRRAVTSQLSQVELVMLGPLLLLGQNRTELEDDPCVKLNTIFQATVYVLCGVGAALLLILLLTAWSYITKCQRPQVQQDNSEQCQ